MPDRSLMLFYPLTDLNSIRKPLLSPCCYKAIYLQRKGKELVGFCSDCNKQVVRENPANRNLEWMEGGRFGA